MASDTVTWIARAGKLTPAAMVIPQRKGVGLSVLPQSKPPGREGGEGESRGETAAAKRGRHRRHTHDSSVSRGAELGKERGWGLPACAEKPAPAQWDSRLARPSGTANPSPDVEVEGAEGKL